MHRPASLDGAGAGRRRTLASLLALGAGAAGLARAQGVAPASRPAVLDQPALPSPKAVQATLLALAQAGQRLVAVGERGTVLLSDDGGRQWRQAAVPVQVTLTSVRFINERTGWAAGHLGVILRSDDGGQRWVRQLDGLQAAAACGALAAKLSDEAAQRRLQRLADEGPDKAFFDLCFADAERGWAVGAYNLAFATRDGGRSWQPISHRLDNPRSLHLYGLARQDGRLLVAGEQGLILRGDEAEPDGALAAQASGYKGSLFGLLAVPGGGLLAHGLRGSLLRSDDVGSNWQPLVSGVPATLSAATVLPDGRVALAAQNGDVLLSADGGRTLTRVAAPPGVPPVAALAAAPGGLLLAGVRGSRLQTLR